MSIRLATGGLRAWDEVSDRLVSVRLGSVPYRLSADSLRRQSPRRSPGPVHREESVTELRVEHHTGEGKLYICAVKDVYSNRIVGYPLTRE